jgi:Family of unknown function (DUF5681)
MALIFLYLAFVLPHNISRHMRSTNKFKMSAFGSLSASKRARTNYAFSRRAGLPSISTLDVRTGRLQWRTIAQPTIEEPVETSATADGNADHKSQSSAERAYSVGYCRPPTHTRFQPGRSGNPKGRPKGALNLKDQRRKVYTDMISLRDGNNKRKVPTLIAVDLVLRHKALQGNLRAAEAVFKNAKELGVFDEGATEPTGHPLDLTDAEIRSLSNEELSQLIAILKRVKEVPPA